MSYYPPIILTGPRQRVRATASISFAPDGYIVTIKEPTRSLDQNARMWAMLADISKAMPDGRRHTPDDWKCLFMHACGWEVQFLDGLDGRRFPSGFKSSRMTVRQMADMITFISAYGDEREVAWSEPHPDERSARADPSRARQAEILCNETLFQQFLERVYETSFSTREKAPEDVAADFVRAYCKVSTRAHLDTEPDRGLMWDQLRSEFDASIGRIGCPDERSAE